MSRSVWKQLTQLLPWTSSAKDTDTLVATIQRFWERNTTDDLLFLFLVVIDAHIQEVGRMGAAHQHLIVCLGTQGGVLGCAWAGQAK